MLKLTTNFQVNVEKLFCSLRREGKGYFENPMSISPLAEVLSLI